MKYRDRQRVLRKLRRLTEADPACRWYGVQTHRYRVARPLTRKQLQHLEARYRVRLPDEYRRFLIYIGNGGVGPGNGLERLGYVKSGDQIPEGQARGPMRVIQETRHGTLMRQRLYDKRGRRLDPFDVSFYETIRSLAPDGEIGPDGPAKPFPLRRPILNDFHQEPDPEWADYEQSDGTLALAHYGSAIYARLILNGHFSGQVWVSDPNCGTFQPFSYCAMHHYCDAEEPLSVDADTLFTFSNWYEHWLDHTLAQVHVEYETAS